jgi:transcriptional regulator with XRE-family HTH domain
MLGKRLSELRKKVKLRQEDLAQKIGIARTTYAMYEQGKREPDYETLQKLADFFEVSTDYLLGRTDNPNPGKEEFEDPELGLWFKELKEASPERQAELRRFWEFIKQQEKDRKPGDKQGE